MEIKDWILVLGRYQTGEVWHYEPVIWNSQEFIKYETGEKIEVKQWAYMPSDWNMVNKRRPTNDVMPQL